VASAFRRTDRSLSDLLFDLGCEFDFFQAVALLERLSPEQDPVGRATLPEREPVRFRAHASYTFPPSQIFRIEEVPLKQPEMTVNFLGLTEPQGVLPAHDNEIAVEQQFFGEHAFSEFLDIFNHRLISFFYRAWEKHRFYIGYEREARGKAGEDWFTRYLMCFAGLGTRGLQNRLAVPDKPMLRYAGLLAQRPHSAAALAKVISDLFGIPATVLQFQGRWQTLEPESLSTMLAPGIHNQLGVGAIAGDAVWDPQAMFTLVLGPLTLEDFVSFLPDQPSFEEAQSVTRFFAGDSLLFDIQLVLRGEEVPYPRLTDAVKEGTPPPRLGWLSWLKTEEFERDAPDAVFTGAAG
jgi:type VI secretion system protein ImpH